MLYSVEDWIEMNLSHDYGVASSISTHPNHHNIETSKSSPRILVSLSLSNDTPSTNQCQHSSYNIPLSTYHTDAEASFPSESGLLQRIRDIAYKEMDIDEKKRQWQLFREREEVRFSEYLRNKEKAYQKHFHHLVKQSLSKQVRLIKNCHDEYKALEARLYTTLSDVEEKEREMKRTLAANNTSYVQRMTELDLREKIMREEAKHMVEMEVCQ